MFRMIAFTLALCMLFVASNGFMMPRTTRKAMTVSMGYVPGKSRFH